MIVSLLQLMGFGMAKPVHSRAVSARLEKPAKPGVKAAKAQDNVRGSPARRQEVKSKTAKPTLAAKAKVAKPVAKPVAKTAKVVASKPSAKSVSKTKAPAKPPVKAVAKPKVAAKTGAKATVKTAVKAASKPKVLAKGKPAAKPVAKPPVKSVAKPAAKSSAAKAKPVPKSTAKLASAVKKTVDKPTSKGVVKAVAKPLATAPAKPSSLASVKPVAAPAASKTNKPVQVIQPVPKSVTPPVASVAPVASAASAPAKAGRPSSRLAQLTVPSMAQSIASTAAKASYSQAAPAAVIIPSIPTAAKKDAKLANNWKTKPVEQLTDADLQAMPDSEYMNTVQLAAFRLKLLALKRDILSNAGETTEHLREDTSVVPDPADRATIEEEHALELRTRDRERKLLKKIEQSIDRIDANDYGYCDETGEPIGVGRLLARPTATLSLEAQQRRELKQKMFGD
jgi:DnaK suppressor protein